MSPRVGTGQADESLAAGRRLPREDYQVAPRPNIQDGVGLQAPVHDLQSNFLAGTLPGPVSHPYVANKNPSCKFLVSFLSIQDSVGFSSPPCMCPNIQDGGELQSRWRGVATPPCVCAPASRMRGWSLNDLGFNSMTSETPCRWPRPQMGLCRLGALPPSSRSWRSPCNSSRRDWGWTSSRPGD